jgi:hypothetical protein
MIDSTTITHRDYAENLETWIMIEDVLKGSRAVKDKGEIYLPNPNPSKEQSVADKLRYSDYKRRALFFNAAKRTISALVGAVYRKVPLIELPTSLLEISYDIDGDGNSIGQQSRQAVKEVISTGRCGLLVDYPQADGSVTVERARIENLRPYIKVYDAQDIVNWSTRKIGAVSILKTITLREDCERDNGLLSVDLTVQYRVLHIDEEGFYCQYIFDLCGDTGSVIQRDKKPVYPTDANGNKLTKLPFVFIGSENNDYNVDPAPMEDLCDVNISHYINSADNEESSFMCGQPSLFVFASNPDIIKEENPDGVKVGARSVNIFGHEDSVEMLQADPNSLPRTNMTDKLDMMVMLGARLITPSQQETAEAARIKHSGDNSALGIIVKNVDDAYTRAIEFLQLFATGKEEEFIFQLNNDFFFEKLTSEDRAAWLSDIVQGVVSKSDYRRALREGGLLADERSDEDIDSDISIDEPISLIDPPVNDFNA